MTLTQRAMLHNSSAFLAELRTASAARSMHGDHTGRLSIDQSIIALETGHEVENEWTITIAKRFLHGVS
ncbi:hypothetical protein ACCS91_33690 [Rhizobium ruizarguesonis]